MTEGVDTCPKCGALITRSLARCRQCKTYLHGTQAEGFVLEHLLPPQLAASPGSGIFFLLIILYYALMVVLAGIDTAAGFTSFTLSQLGSTWSPAIYEGQHWRFVTSAFAHGDVVHLAFNLYAITIVGPLIEEAFDRKKMMVIYLLTGVLSMAISHYVYTLWFGQVVRSSVGASGAASGLIGACFVASRRIGPSAARVQKVMLTWTAYMAIWGLVTGGRIDNVAHAGGWLVGAALATVVPLGLTRSVAANRALSVLVIAQLLGVAACVGLMLDNLRGFPVSLERDAQPRSVFFFTYADGAEWDHSDQRMAYQRCLEALGVVGEETAPPATQIRRCELAIRILPEPSLYRALAAVHDAEGDADRARELRRVARILSAGRGEPAPPPG